MNQENVKIKLNFNGEGTVWTVRDNANLSSRASPRAGPIITLQLRRPLPGPCARRGRCGRRWWHLVRSSALYGGRNPADRKAAAQRSFQPPRRPVLNVVQPYQHHENVPPVGINVYSFALKPRTTSLPARATCRVLTTPRSAAAREMATGSQVSVYATNYNVLRINVRGLGSLTRPDCLWLPVVVVCSVAFPNMAGHLHLMGLT
jgi:hypothetical protein